MASRSEGLIVRWRGFASGAATAWFISRERGGESVTTECTFDAARGEGLVPPAVIAKFPPDDMPYFAVFAESRRVLTPEGWLVRIAARTELQPVSISVR